MKLYQNLKSWKQPCVCLRHNPLGHIHAHEVHSSYTEGVILGPREVGWAHVPPALLVSMWTCGHQTFTPVHRLLWILLRQICVQSIQINVDIVIGFHDVIK